MTAGHYNGESDPRLQAIAEAERAKFKANGGHAGNRHDTEPRPQRGPWQHELEPFEALDFATLSDDPDFGREFAVDGWFPMLETTGFGGPGGEGKTTLAHMLATAAPIGHSWLGLSVEEMCAALVLCEDRARDAHLRQADINRHYGCRMVDLAGQLLVLPRRVKQHNCLAMFDLDGELHTTSFFGQLLDELKKFAGRRRLLTILDGRSDIFRGNQNDENHARSFVRRVPDRIAEETNGACVLLYQPSQTGKANGSGESGSVQWDAAYRCRTALETDPKDPTLRKLIRKKSNFAPKNEELLIRWERGVFVRADGPGSIEPSFERAARLAKAERVFIAMFDRFAQANKPVSPNPGSNYAPALFAKNVELVEGCTKDELEAAMNSLMYVKHSLIIDNSGRSPKLVKVAANAGDCNFTGTHTLPHTP